MNILRGHYDTRLNLLTITDSPVWGRRNFMALTGLSLVVFPVLTCQDLPQSIFSTSHSSVAGHRPPGICSSKKKNETETGLLHIAVQLNYKPLEGQGHMVYLSPLLCKRLTWTCLHRRCLITLVAGRCPRHYCHLSIHHLGPSEVSILSSLP